MRNFGHRRTVRRGIQEWDQPGAPTMGDPMEWRGRKSKSRERNINSTEISHWKNFGGFSLSSTFVPAIGFSTYILLYYIPPSTSMWPLPHPAHTPDHPQGWRCLPEAPGTPQFGSSGSSGSLHQYLVESREGCRATFQRLQDFPKLCLSCRITLYFGFLKPKVI